MNGQGSGEMKSTRPLDARLTKLPRGISITTSTSGASCCRSGDSLPDRAPFIRASIQPCPRTVPRRHPATHMTAPCAASSPRTRRRGQSRGLQLTAVRGSPRRVALVPAGDRALRSPRAWGPWFQRTGPRDSAHRAAVRAGTCRRPGAPCPAAGPFRVAVSPREIRRLARPAAGTARRGERTSRSAARQPAGSPVPRSPAAAATRHRPSRRRRLARARPSSGPGGLLGTADHFDARRPAG